MHIEARLFEILTAFFALTAIVYAVLTAMFATGGIEWAGTTALVLFAIYLRARGRVTNLQMALLIVFALLVGGGYIYMVWTQAPPSPVA